MDDMVAEAEAAAEVDTKDTANILESGTAATATIPQATTTTTATNPTHPAPEAHAPATPPVQHTKDTNHTPDLANPGTANTRSGITIDTNDMNGQHMKHETTIGMLLLQGSASLQSSTGSIQKIGKEYMK